MSWCPAARNAPSGENARDETSLFTWKRWTSSPLRTSHIGTNVGSDGSQVFPSHPLISGPDATTNLPSGVKASAPRGLMCPLNVRNSFPVFTSISRRTRSGHIAARMLPSGEKVAASERVRSEQLPEKIPAGLVNLRPGVFVYLMSVTETPAATTEISAPGRRSRGHDGTQSRELLG